MRIPGAEVQLSVAIALGSALCAADSQKAGSASRTRGGQDWPAYGGGFADMHHSPLKQINCSIVAMFRSLDSSGVLLHTGRDTAYQSVAFQNRP
jgi:hypothetical protein